MCQRGEKKWCINLCLTFHRQQTSVTHNYTQKQEHNKKVYELEVGKINTVLYHDILGLKIILIHEGPSTDILLNPMNPSKKRPFI